MSLQYHNYRDETWKIISGTGIVNIECNAYNVNYGDIVNICKKQLHQIKNITNYSLIFIEIQTGQLIYENDIIRINDIYDRQ